MQKRTLKKDSKKIIEQKARAKRIVAVLKQMYPIPKSELTYTTPMQFLVAVMMSAQCSDKVVNRVTNILFKKYKTPADFARAKQAALEKEISSVTFYRNKAKAIIGAAIRIEHEFGGVVPNTAESLITLPGVAYKTAHVVLGELYKKWEGIPTDTHVKRFARRFELTDNIDLEKISKDLEALVPQKDWKYVNNGLVLYGRYACPARPHDCTQHPLTKLYPRASLIWPKVS